MKKLFLLLFFIPNLVMGLDKFFSLDEDLVVSRPSGINN